jgi:hypothetical protein
MLCFIDVVFSGCTSSLHNRLLVLRQTHHSFHTSLMSLQRTMADDIEQIPRACRTSRTLEEYEETPLHPLSSNPDPPETFLHAIHATADPLPVVLRNIISKKRTVRQPQLPDESPNDGVQPATKLAKKNKTSKGKKTLGKFGSGAPFGQQLRAILFPHWYTLNWLLLACPVGFTLRYTQQSDIVIFFVNFVASIPLAGITSYLSGQLLLGLDRNIAIVLYITLWYELSSLYI